MSPTAKAVVIGVVTSLAVTLVIGSIRYYLRRNYPESTATQVMGG